MTDILFVPAIADTHTIHDGYEKANVIDHI
jgi:hypothetical protein